MVKNKKKKESQYIEMQAINTNKKENKSKEDKELLKSFVDSLVQLNEAVKNDVKIKYSFFNIKNRKSSREWEKFKKDWKANYVDPNKDFAQNFACLERDMMIILEYKNALGTKHKNILDQTSDLYPLVRKHNVIGDLKQIELDFKRCGTDKKEYLQANEISKDCAKELIYRVIYQQRTANWLRALAHQQLATATANATQDIKEFVSKQFLIDYASKLGYVVLRRQSCRSNFLAM